MNKDYIVKLFETDFNNPGSEKSGEYFKNKGVKSAIN